MHHSMHVVGCGKNTTGATCEPCALNPIRTIGSLAQGAAANAEDLGASHEDDLQDECVKCHRLVQCLQFYQAQSLLCGDL